ncbi:MAG: tetratricopeptide repeat protein [Roseomonas sp.]|nr:tetratricopeptide repeat protein [Roseomonas sp.]
MQKPRQVTDQIFSKAIAALRQGDLAKAEALCLAVLDLDPRHVEALRLSGLAAIQAGRPDEGANRLQLATQIRPKDPILHNNLALALIKQGRDLEALVSFETALVLDPEAIDVRQHAGNLLHKLGRHSEAVAAFDRIIAKKPDDADAHHHRGHALADLQQFEEAYDAHEKAHRLQPHSAAYIAGMASVLCNLKRHNEAKPLIEKALAIQPDMELALLCRADTLLSEGRLQESLDPIEAVIAAHPYSLQGHFWRCKILVLLGQPERALMLSAASRGIELGNPLTFINHGFILGALNRFEEAIGFYDRALKIKPDDTEAHHNRAFALLTLGRFEEGWLAYEYRNLRKKPSLARNYSKPLWWGDEPLKDQKLFVYSEQGLGDTIHFGRYALLAAERGATVCLSVQKPLYRLFRGFHPKVLVISSTEVPVEFDLHCPLLSLPLAFRTRLETIPAWPDGYLKAPEKEAARWAQRLPRGRRIGLVWSGSNTHSNDANRSIALARLRPLFQSSDVWISLQKEVRERDQTALQASGLLDLTAELEDFADTAALISALDLVIAVDTSVAHLAAALGKPVWLMLPFAPDFRWLLDREDSPWYPSMRLFRQPRPGDWDSVITRIADALRA